jgi:hypothetical protein
VDRLPECDATTRIEFGEAAISFHNRGRMRFRSVCGHPESKNVVPRPTALFLPPENRPRARCGTGLPALR